MATGFLAADLFSSTRPPDEARAASTATTSLLAATAAALEQASSAIDASLRRQMTRHIDAHLGSARLCADTLCKAFKVSRTTLYRLFEPLGGVAQEIKARRLKRIHQALTSPEMAIRQVAVIAEEFGFADPTYFSRAFRQRFGYTPSQARAGAAASGGQQDSQYHYDRWMRTLQG